MRSAIANWQQGKGKRRIILVIETDLDHGGIAFDAHKKDCWHNDKDVYNALFEYGSGSYVQPKIIFWYRYKELQEVRSCAHFCRPCP